MKKTLADPQDGLYAGTHQQGYPIEITVASRTITRCFREYDCGAWHAEATSQYTPGMPVVAGSFSFGSPACIPGGSLRISGTFDTPSSVSGLMDIWDQPSGFTCCQISNLGWSASHGSSQDNPIQGLGAANNGPTALGSPTILTATVTGGTNITYTWDLGDGSSATGGGTVARRAPLCGWS